MPPLTSGDMHPTAMPAAGPVDTADMLFAMTQQPDEPAAVQEDAGLPLGVPFMPAPVEDDTRWTHARTSGTTLAGAVVDITVLNPPPMICLASNQLSDNRPPSTNHASRVVPFKTTPVEDGMQALHDRPGLLLLRDRLQEDRRRLQADNHSLQTSKTELEAENRRLETENRSLQAQVRRFKDAWRQIAHISGCALKDTVRAP